MTNNINEYIDYKLDIILNRKKKQTKTILVLSGGGIKGISHIGSLKALSEKGILKNIHTIAGTSIGGWIGTLHVIGYTPDEMIRFIELFDINKIRSINKNFSDFFKNFGIDNGNNIVFILEKMFTAKGFSTNITFNELFKKTNIKLILTTTCMNDKQAHYLSYLTYPDMPVILGIRMTISLPFWLTPVEYKGKKFIDGGCIDNFPIRLFQNELNNVLGLFLSVNTEYTENISNTEDFLFGLLNCLFEGIKYNSIKGYENCTINVEVPKINIMNLDINNSLKKELFHCGYYAVKKYLDIHI